MRASISVNTVILIAVSLLFLTPILLSAGSWFSYIIYGECWWRVQDGVSKMQDRMPRDSQGAQSVVLKDCVDRVEIVTDIERVSVDVTCEKNHAAYIVIIPKEKKWYQFWKPGEPKCYPIEGVTLDMGKDCKVLEGPKKEGEAKIYCILFKAVQGSTQVNIACNEVSSSNECTEKLWA